RSRAPTPTSGGHPAAAAPVHAGAHVDPKRTRLGEWPGQSLQAEVDLEAIASRSYDCVLLDAVGRLGSET
ncbi:MAG: hypothetical protein ACXVXP_15440, partial [Mycobacteriaceae bacterium]